MILTIIFRRQLSLFSYTQHLNCSEDADILNSYFSKEADLVSLAVVVVVLD